MADGFFQGGFAEGIKSSNATLAAELAADQRGQIIEDARTKAKEDAIDKSIAGIVKTTTDVVNAARAAGASPDKIKGLVAPLLQDVERFSAIGGRDHTPILRQLDALIGIPQAPEGESKPGTEIGKLRADLDAGHITQEQYSARVNRLTEPTRQVNVVEGIRQKISGGQELTAGERTVYDDALKADPLARLLLGLQGGNPATPQAVPSAPKPSAKEQSFSSAEEIEKAVKAKTVRHGDIVILNGQRVRVQP